MTASPTPETKTPVCPAGREETPSGRENPAVSPTSRERVLATINHQEPDRMAVDFGGTTCSTMAARVLAELRKYYGLPEKPVEVLDICFMSGLIDEELQDRLGTDVALAPPRVMSYGFHRDQLKLWTTPWDQKVLAPNDFTCAPDGQGGFYTYPQGDLSAPPSGYMPQGGAYFNGLARGEKVRKDRLDPRDNLEEYQLFTPEDVAFIKQKVETAYATGRAVSFTLPGGGLGDIGDVLGIGLKRPKGIRTIEDWYMAPIRYPEYVLEVFDRQTDISIANLKMLYEAVGEKIQHLALCGTDFAHQRSLFISPELVRKIYLPSYRKTISWVHQNTGWKVGKHSCGAIVPLIPLFIEAGFDTLNPVQCSAEGMDPKTLKKEFGRHITFWGGGVNTQQTLPFGTPEEVRREVLERCEIFAPGGGFVFNAIHIVQAGVPVENVAAMIDAVAEFNGR